MLKILIFTALSMSPSVSAQSPVDPVQEQLRAEGLTVISAAQGAVVSGWGFSGGGAFAEKRISVAPVPPIRGMTTIRLKHVPRSG